jgi:hypothetical protein
MRGSFSFPCLFFIGSFSLLGFLSLFFIFLSDRYGAKIIFGEAVHFQMEEK